MSNTAKFWNPHPYESQTSCKYNLMIVMPPYVHNTSITTPVEDSVSPQDLPKL